MGSPMLPTTLNGHDTRYGTPVPGSGNGGLAPHSQNAETFRLAGSPAPSSGTTFPDPEMTEKAKHRRFPKSYKLRIVEEADQCVGRGDLGALLRREGLYASTLANFRRQEADGLLDPGPARRPQVSKDPQFQALVVRCAELERGSRRLRRDLEHAKKIISIQKKAAILLGETLQDMNLDEED